MFSYDFLVVGYVYIFFCLGCRMCSGFVWLVKLRCVDELVLVNGFVSVMRMFWWFIGLVVLEFVVVFWWRVWPLWFWGWMVWF